LPNEPFKSTPTKTSPVGAAQRQAGQGVRSAPEKRDDSSPGGTAAEPMAADERKRHELRRWRRSGNIFEADEKG
jgi:hypothetical protein